MSAFWRQLSRDAHEVSKIAGDVNAYETGGFPRLARRIARRIATREAFRLGGNR